MTFPGENISPSWLRARIIAIRKLIEELQVSSPDRAIIRNGIIPEKQQKRFKEIVDFEYKLSFALNEALTFSEITSFNTWFTMHPEKICGKEIITTSREFPISVKGTKEDIINTINAGINQTVEHNSNSTQAEFFRDTKNIEPESQNSESNFSELEALALETELLLLKI